MGLWCWCILSLLMVIAAHGMYVELFIDNACGTPFQQQTTATFCDTLATGKSLVVCNGTQPVSYTCPSGCTGNYSQSNCTQNAPSTWPGEGVCMPAPPPQVGSGRFTCETYTIGIVTPTFTATPVSVAGATTATVVTLIALYLFI